VINEFTVELDDVALEVVGVVVELVVGVIVELMRMLFRCEP
jgi:hypothetical protein